MGGKFLHYFNGKYQALGLVTKSTRLSPSMWEFPQKDPSRSSEDVSVCFILSRFVLLLFFSVVALWSLRPLGRCDFYHHFSSLLECTECFCPWVYTSLPMLASCSQADVDHLLLQQNKSLRSYDPGPSTAVLWVGPEKCEFLTLHHIASLSRMRTGRSLSIAPLWSHHRNLATRVLLAQAHASAGSTAERHPPTRTT